MPTHQHPTDPTQARVFTNHVNPLWVITNIARRKNLEASMRALTRFLSGDWGDNNPLAAKNDESIRARLDGSKILGFYDEIVVLAYIKVAGDELHADKLCVATKSHPEISKLSAAEPVCA